MRHLLGPIVAIPLFAGCGWQPPAPVTRADLGNTLLRFEALYKAEPPADENVADINRAFDQATLSFFLGNNSSVIRGIEETAAALRSKEAWSPALRAASALKVRIEPPMFVPASSPPPFARITPTFDPRLEDGTRIELTLQIRAGDDAVVCSEALSLSPPPGFLVDLRVPLASLPASPDVGTYTVQLSTPDGTSLAMGRWFVLGRSPQETRDDNDDQLDRVDASAPELAQALLACRSRNDLLGDRPSEDRLAEYLADPTSLIPSLQAEIESLVHGKNPYKNRPGDYWRTYRVGVADVPARVFLPPAKAAAGPVPLLIAFHGAGVDENIYFDAYGSGILKELADERGIMVVAPFTNPFLMEPGLFMPLIDAIEMDVSVDRRRIYVLGHSLGGVTTALVARAHPDRIAAACCISSGGDLQNADALPPTLVMIGDIDAISRPAAVRSGAERAMARGLPVELRRRSDYGHTLLVGAVLPEAIDWLLEHTGAAASMP